MYNPINGRGQQKFRLPHSQLLSKKFYALQILSIDSRLHFCLIGTHNSVPVFVVVTKSDKISITSQRHQFQTKVKSAFPFYKELFFISNYVRHEDLKVYPIAKRNTLTDAFVEIFHDESHFRSTLQRLYTGQKILLLGTPGTGKSAFIKSFFYYAGAGPEECNILADVSSMIPVQTENFTPYSWCHDKKKAPSVTFLDTRGMPHYGGFHCVVDDLLEGRIQSDANMKEILEEIDIAQGDGKPCNEDTCPRYYKQKTESQCLKPSVVLIFVDSTSSPPTEFLTSVKTAVTKRPEMKVFVIATRADVIDGSGECYDEILEIFAGYTVLKISNKLPKNEGDDVSDDFGLFGAYMSIAEHSK
eukprot:m.184482 g.184482  ORF g.184482 m.184482 type:complete len:358 (+) comp39322_c0_seq1:875-1948(+)